jgi:hypothetical protein
VSRLVVLIGLLAACSRLTLASDIESWNAVEPEYKDSHIRLVLQSQFRFRSDLGGFYASRTGPRIQFYVKPHFIPMVGYLYKNYKSTPSKWNDSHRAYGGVEIPLHDGRWTAETRLWYERFFGDVKPSFNRYRQGVRVIWKHHYAPVGGVDTFQTSHGFYFIRPYGGIRWNMNSRSSIEFSYLYEAYRSGMGQNRHIVMTRLRFKVPGRHAEKHSE